jgi:hypothetical protein
MLIHIRQVAYKVALFLVKIINKDGMLISGQFQRAIDNYPRAVDQYVLQPLAEAIFKDLHDHLQLYSSGDANERCTELLADSPVVKLKYESLTSKVKMLEKVLDRMGRHVLGSKGGD